MGEKYSIFLGADQALAACKLYKKLREEEYKERHEEDGEAEEKHCFKITLLYKLRNLRPPMFLMVTVSTKTFDVIFIIYSKKILK